MTTRTPRRFAFGRGAMPRRALVAMLAGSLVLAVAGAFGGRVAAPKAAPGSVSVAPLPSTPATDDPIVRPERLELPR